MSELHQTCMCKSLLNGVMTPDYLFNHTNCFEQGTFRHTYRNLIFQIWHHSHPPPFFLLSFPAFHQDWKCAWGMLRQPCLNYSLTLWPMNCIDTTWHNCTGLQLAASLCCGGIAGWCEIQTADHVSTMYLFTGLHLWVTLNCRGCHPSSSGTGLALHIEP